MICGGVAVELLTYVRFDAIVESRLAPFLGTCSHQLVLLGWLVAGLIFMRTWIGDVWWLFFCRREEFDAWLDELQDAQSPKQDHGKLMRSFYWLRKKLHG